MHLEKNIYNIVLAGITYYHLFIRLFSYTRQKQMALAL